MAKQYPFHIKSGIPFAKTLNVTLPNGRTYWTSDADFEVLSEVRKSADTNSDLLLSLTPFLTVTFSAPDAVEVKLEMTGKDTRALLEAGYYDIVISDVYNDDAKAITLLEGPVHRESVVTGPSAGAP